MNKTTFIITVNAVCYSFSQSCSPCEVCYSRIIKNNIKLIWCNLKTQLHTCVVLYLFQHYVFITVQLNANSYEHFAEF